MVKINVAGAAETAKRIEQAEQQAKAQRDTAFRQKVAMQQFMNSNGPIFRAFANKGVRAVDIQKAGVLNGLISDAMALASQTAAYVYRKEVAAVTAAESRPFRVGAAEWVAAHWTGGKKIDVALAASQIAEAANLVDEQWDHDIYQDDGISQNASYKITMSAVAGNLFTCVANYAFRIDPRLVTTQIVSAVMNNATESAKKMLPEGTPPEIANLEQTLARNLSNLMEACYDQKAREVLKELYQKDESFKIAYLDQHRPFEKILANFNQWAEWFAWILPQAAERTAKVSTTEAPAPEDGSLSRDERF